MADRDIGKEIENLFTCRRRPQDDDARLQAGNSLKRRVADQPLELGIAVGEHLKLPARIAGYGGAFDDRLDGEGVLVPSGEAEEVARQQEIYDSSPAFRRQRAFPRQAGGDAIPIFGPISLIVDSFPAVAPHDRGERFHSGEAAGSPWSDPDRVERWPA